jgi:PKD repeat protein
LKMGEMLYRIIIENQPPIVNLNWTPKNPKASEGVIFDVSWSYDPDGSVKLYEWDWNNDGIYEESHTTLITAHSWSKAGNYPVTLKVTDDDGANSTKTISISVDQSTTPGFEIIFVIFAIALSIILWKKKK